MNNKKNLTKLTNDRLKSSKWLLTVSAALSALVNLVTLVALLIGGVDFEYWIVPLVLTLVDGAFLAAVIVSNYRFRYAHTQPVYYTVLTLAGAIWTFLANGIVDETLAYTTFSSYAWLILHGVSCFAVLLSAWKAAKFGENGKRFREWAALAVVALVATTGVCGYFSFKDGVFGQGSLMETRALEFSYDDENGYYRVVGLVKGRGKTVSVPKEFNGEKVGAVDCSALDDKSVKTVRFADATVVLENPELLVTDRTANRVIYVDKSECDLFRERFFKMAYEGSSEAYLRVANAVVPEGLGDDEIYVTFTYDLGGLQAVDGKTLDTWYGQKGESVDFATVAKDAEYVQKNDPNNADHLYWSYDNLGKKMYKGVEADGVLTDGKNLDASVQNLTVVFEPLYAVNVAADNDGRYELADSFRYGEYNGRQRSRIVTKATADEWLGSVVSRDGFTLAWKYGGSKTPFTSLAAVVSDDLTVYPEWTMRAPTIEILATDKPNGAIYGDTVTFFATASAPNPSLSLRYEWTNKNSTVSNERDWDFSNVYPEDSGEYTLTVTAYSDTLTTLTSEASDSVEITVGKKALGFTWTLPSDLTYSAADKTVLAAHNANDVINDDLITFDLSLSKVRDIGDYSSTVSLTEACADLYFVKPADQTVEFKVVPYEISVNWADTALTYNGDNQKPTASATGLGADGALPLTVTGEQKNAGDNYTAIVTTSNVNYKIANSTQTFAIAKATVEMAWTKTSLTYNGYAQKPKASAAGLGADGTLVANVSGEMKNVGTNYIATATLNATDAKNYQISTESASHTFSVSKVTIGVAWTNISLTYNGESQLPTASVKGLGEDKTLEIVSLVELSSGDGINAGDHEATASTTNGNYVISNPTESFTIRKKTVDVVWTDLTFTYDGSAHKPTASVTGVDKDGALNVTVSGERVNAGKGTATATLETQWTANYELKTATVNKSFTINKKAVTLVWQSEREFVYDGTAKNISVIEVQGLISADSHDEILGGVTYVAATEKKTVGQYSRTAKLPDDGNYVIETGATQSYTIAQREISFVWDSDLTFTYGEDLTGKALVQSVVGGIGSSSEDSLIIFGLAYDAMQKDAGTYVRKATLSDSGVSANYKLAEAEQGCEYTIEKAKLTISLWTPGTFTFIYNGEAQYLKVNSEFSVAGVVGDEQVTFSYAVTDSVNVGEYTQTATLAADNDVNKNYEIVAGASKQYSIVKKTLGIVWKNDFTYNGGEQYAEVDSVIGAANGEKPTFTYAVKNTVDAGEYTQTATLAADNDINKNYEIVSGSETCQYTIRKKQISLNWNSSFTYNGEIQIAKVESVEGVIGNQEPTFTYAVTNTVDAGEYTQTVALEEGNAVNKNYEILSGFVTRQYQIEKKKISLTWKDTSLTYNGAAQYATVESVSGLIGDEQVTFTYEVMNSVNAQAYSQKAILVDGNDVNKNYSIEWASETCGFTIKAKEITLTWKDTSLTYNGEAQYATVASVEGVIGDEQVTFSYGVTDSVEAGSYTQTATTSNGNYKIKNPTQTFTIAEAPDQDEQA